MIEDWPQPYERHDCSKCKNIFCKNAGKYDERIKVAYCDHYKEEVKNGFALR